MKSHCCSAPILYTEMYIVCSNCKQPCNLKVVDTWFEAKLRANASKKFEKDTGWWKNINKYLKLCQKQIDIDKN
jgi:hypothetical protein